MEQASVFSAGDCCAGNLTEVYGADFTKLRFSTLPFFSILGNVNEVKKKESPQKGHKKGDHIMRKLVAAALVGVMTMGLTVGGVSADGGILTHPKISPSFPVRTVPVPEALSSSCSVFVRKNRMARK